MSQKNFSSYDNLISLFTSIKNKITAIRNESSQLIKDTNGWIGKNLLVTPYYHGMSKEDAGITYTVDGTGRVTADGTASNWSNFWLENEFKVKAGTYILTGIPETENEVYIAFEYGGSTHETITKDIRSTRIRFNNDTTVLIRITIKTGETVNNLVFEPMLRYASISDDTYEPYHEDVARFVDTKAKQWLNGAVGWTGKNLAPIKIDYVKSYNTQSGASWDGNTLTRNGMTFVFTVDNNGYVTSIAYSGTPTSDDFQVRLFDGLPMAKGNYILTGASAIQPRLRLSNGRTGSDVIIGHQGNNPFPFTLDNSDNSLRLSLRIQTTSAISGTIIQPMIRLASVSDDTFEPYHDTVKDSMFLRKEQSILGTKNLYKPVPARTETVENINWIINADGTVEADGTCSSTTSKLQITERYGRSGEKQFFPNGKYIINGNPDDSTTFLQVGVTKNGVYTALAQGVGDVVFEVDGDDSSNDGAYVQIVCSVIKNKTVSHVLFKPMIRLASDPDNTYVPYAMSNKELTVEKANNSAIAPVIDQDTAPYAIPQGKPFMHYGDFCIAKTAIASGATLIKDSNYTVGTVGDSLGLEVLTLDITNAATEQGITFDSTRKTAIRWGHIVSVGLRFTVANTITLSSQLNLCNAFPLYDSSWLPYLIITDRSSPYGVKDFSGFVSANGSFMLPATTIEAGNYDIRGTYICS